MDFDKLFEKAIKRFFDKQKGSITQGIVKEVNGNKATIERDGEPNLYNVRLQAIEDEASSFIRVKPKLESVVLCGIIEKQEAEAFIIQCSEIDEVTIVTGNKTYQVNSEGHLLKAGDDTLKEVLQLIIEAVQFIIVLKGRNPDRVKLEQAIEKLNNIFQ